MTRNAPGISDAVFSALLGEVRRLQPSELPRVLQRHCPALGAKRISIYLADIRQELLVELPESSESAPRQLPIDSSLAGWVYRSLSERVSPSPTDGLVLWLPMIDGIERLGVLGIETDTLDGPALERCQALSTIVTLILVAKGFASDFYARSQRTQKMEISAEMVWAFLPPRSIGSRLATSSAILEPAYDLGGDAFDHAITDSTLHVTLVDGMGHDMPAGLSAAVALAACRNARRSGPPRLLPLVHGVDHVLTDAFHDRPTTGIFAHLNLNTGQLNWVNAGHPPPLLLRGNELIHRALEGEPEPPLGLPAGLADTGRTLHEAHLQPGDRVLLHTDGVTDARDTSDQPFGLERFTDFILRAMAADEPPPEALRRLVKTIVEHHQSRLIDDATIMMFQWHPAHAPHYFT